jgi:RNA polymerase primary sigma factor
VRKLLLHNQLDVVLDQAALTPGSFEAVVDEMIARVDGEDADLEVRDSRTWRRGAATPKTTFVEQFRADVQAIMPLGRLEEAQLARRIEFARRRNEITRLREGPSSPRSLRRATELHALRSEMVERNLYLVLINAERYAQRNTLRMDLVQEGCVSLFRAVDGFDWRRGLLFRTYAVHWLNQAFRNYLYNNSHIVRVPVYLQKALRGINDAASRLEAPNADPQTLSLRSQMEERFVESALMATRGTYSLDVEGAPQGDASLKSIIVDHNAAEPYSVALEDVSLEDGLGKAMESLSERERKVLNLRFGIGGREHTLAEVAANLGVSVERVRQIQVRAIAKLNTPPLRKQLEPFLN